MSDYTDLITELQQKLDTELGVERLIHTENKKITRNNQNTTSINEANITQYNMHLRCLSLANAVCFALTERNKETLKKELESLVNKLIRENSTLTEIEFNTNILKILHEADLTDGCHTSKEAQQLLGYYRNMSAVLEPILSLETQTKVNDITLTELQKPIAIKDNANTTNDYHPNKAAFNKAHGIFLSKINENGMLPAQARKTHPQGLKNAFEVTVTIEQNDGVKKEFNFIRMGSPVPELHGLTEEQIKDFTTKNLEQLQGQYTGKQLTIVTLNTETFDLNHEGQLVHTLRTLSNNTNPELKFTWLHHPLNFLSRMLGFFMKNPYPDLIEEIKTILKKDSNQMLVIHCSSGQDRTGTLIEALIQSILKDENITPEDITKLRTACFNTAEISTHLCPGSSGLKQDSCYKGLFSEDIEHVLYHRYRHSANTNKNPPVGDCAFLKKPAHSHREQFNTLLKDTPEKLKKAIGELKTETKLSAADIRLLIEVMEAVKTPDPKTLEAIANRLHQLQDQKKWRLITGFVVSALAAILLIGIIVSGVTAGLGLPILIGLTAAWVTTMSAGLSECFHHVDAYSQSKAVAEISTAVRSCIPGNE